MQIKRLNHIQITIPVGEEERAREFYQGILNLEEIEKPQELKANGGLWYKIADIELHIGVEDLQPPSKRHPAFEVEALAEIKQYLEMKNVLTKVETKIPGINRFSFYDPFGNRFELIERESVL